LAYRSGHVVKTSRRSEDIVLSEKNSNVIVYGRPVFFSCRLYSETTIHTARHLFRDHCFLFIDARALAIDGLLSKLRLNPDK